MAHAATIMVLEVVLIAFYEFKFVDVGVVQVFVVNTEIVHPRFVLFSNTLNVLISSHIHLKFKKIKTRFDYALNY